MIENLITELSKFGLVEVCNDDFVFTLYMQKDVEFFNARSLCKILNLCCDYTSEDKPNIELIKKYESIFTRAKRHRTLGRNLK